MAIYYGNQNVKPNASKVYVGSNLVYEDTPEPFTGLCFTANTAGSTVELTVSGTPPIANSAYSRDGITWTSFAPSTAGTNTVTLTNVGDKVYFRNDITGEPPDGEYIKFSMTGSISASGNCNSMYSSTNYNELTTLDYAWCFFRLFYLCSSLTSAPYLPATTLSEGCYCMMFDYCTSLTSVPKLPATTLFKSCYGNMFQNCKSLYVSDTQTSSAQYAWTIPESGAFTNDTTYNQLRTFLGCLGTRSSNDMSGAQGESHTYYTQNQPV